MRIVFPSVRDYFRLARDTPRIVDAKPGDRFLAMAQSEIAILCPAAGSRAGRLQPPQLRKKEDVAWDGRSKSR
jgi:hypothetical protein